MPEPVSRLQRVLRHPLLWPVLALLVLLAVNVAVTPSLGRSSILRRSRITTSRSLSRNTSSSSAEMQD